VRRAFVKRAGVAGGVAVWLSESGSRIRCVVRLDSGDRLKARPVEVGIDSVRPAVQEPFIVDRPDVYRLRHAIAKRDAEASPGIHCHSRFDHVAGHFLTLGLDAGMGKWRAHSTAYPTTMPIQYTPHRTKIRTTSDLTPPLNHS
jgi:hypothetical protein